MNKIIKTELIEAYLEETRCPKQNFVKFAELSQYTIENFEQSKREIKCYISNYKSYGNIPT